VVNEIKLQVIEEFLQLCKEYSNGNMERCYQDLLNKIQFIEIEDHLDNIDIFKQIFLN